MIYYDTPDLLKQAQSIKKMESEMNPEIHDIQFTAQHHALLFAVITKSVIQKIGEEKGDSFIRKAVREYGRQRGKRMAMRAMEEGHNPTLAAYFAYGEWEVPKNEMDSGFIEQSPHARMQVHQCPWHATWEKYDLMAYGKLYCMEIDDALVKGFNPNLEISVNTTRTNGGDLCDFVFKDAHLTENKIIPKRQTILPWGYHIAHLYSTFGARINQKFPQTAGGILENAINEFSLFFPNLDILQVCDDPDTDFEKLPG